MKKKTLKAILAAALAVIMTIPCFSAFAANNTLVWDFYGQEYIYDYAGEIAVGSTAIPADASDYIWYSFDVQNEGFYYIHYNYDNMDAWFGIPEEFEGAAAYNEKDFIYYGPDGGDGAIYYLEEGKTIVGFDLFYYEEDASFETEFLGAEITEIKPQYDLIYDYDVYGEEYMGKNEFGTDAHFDVTFSDKTITLNALYGTTENVLAAGENTFKTEILGQECEFTANVYYITDYIESVEISNIEDYLYVYNYYNSTEFKYPVYETFRATFTNGTTYTVDIYDNDMIVLPNGREVGFGFNVRETAGGDFCFDVYAGGNRLASYECEVKSVSVEENFDRMVQASQSHLSDAGYYLTRAFEVAFEDGILGFFSYGAEESMMRIEWAISSFVAAFNEMSYLMLYLLS